MSEKAEKFESKGALLPAHVVLIRILAKRVVTDYLTRQAATNLDSDPVSTERVTLPPVGKAA